MFSFSALFVYTYVSWRYPGLCFRERVFFSDSGSALWPFLSSGFTSRLLSPIVCGGNYLKEINSGSPVSKVRQTPLIGALAPQGQSGYHLLTPTFPRRGPFLTGRSIQFCSD